MVRVDRIATECTKDGKKDASGAGGKQKDDFLAAKSGLYQLLYEVKENIRERHTLQRRNGNTYETIRKGAEISEQLKQIDVDFKKIQDIHKKQRGFARRRSLGLTDEELDNRLSDLNLLKQQIEEARTAFRNNRAISTDKLTSMSGASPLSTRTTTADHVVPPRTIGAPTAREGGGEVALDIAEERRALGLSSPGGGAREPTEAERQAMDRWKRRDQAMDRQLDEIGEGVERLGDIAQNINATADRHTVMAQEIARSADKAHSNLQTLSLKMKKVMETQRNSTFFCRIILVVVLIGCVGYIYWAITNQDGDR